MNCYTERKFTDQDVLNHSEFTPEAIQWAQRRVLKGAGSDWLRDTLKAVNVTGQISVAQTRGLLNMMRVEVLATNPSKPSRSASTASSTLDITKLPKGKYELDGTVFEVDNVADPKSRWDGWVFVGFRIGNKSHPYGAHRPGYGYKGKDEAPLRRLVEDPDAYKLTRSR